MNTERTTNEENLVKANQTEAKVNDSLGLEIMEKNRLINETPVESSRSTGQKFVNENINKGISSKSELEEPECVSQNHLESNSHYGCVEKVKSYNDVAPVPVKHISTIVNSLHVSDRMPLLENESSVASSINTDLNIGGESETPETSCDCSYIAERDSDQSSLSNVLPASESKEHLIAPGSVRVPIVGHEVVEARSKFTVFKIHVMIEDDDAGWFIFRRYSDFLHLNDQLRILFPNFRFSLPPKRWFRSNFDLDFLEERVLGLQAFVDNVTGHKDVCNSKPVKDFFCFGDPPGPHDSLEESRAQCECMEETIYVLRKELTEKDREIELLNEEMALYKNQVQLLTNRLSELKRHRSFERSGSEKYHSTSGDVQIHGDNPLLPSDKLLYNKLNTSTKLK